MEDLNELVKVIFNHEQCDKEANSLIQRCIDKQISCWLLNFLFEYGDFHSFLTCMSKPFFLMTVLDKSAFKKAKCLVKRRKVFELILKSCELKLLDPKPLFIIFMTNTLKYFSFDDECISFVCKLAPKQHQNTIYPDVFVRKDWLKLIAQYCNYQRALELCKVIKPTVSEFSFLVKDCIVFHNINLLYGVFKDLSEKLDPVACKRVFLFTVQFKISKLLKLFIEVPNLFQYVEIDIAIQSINYDISFPNVIQYTFDVLCLCHYYVKCKPETGKREIVNLLKEGILENKFSCTIYIVKYVEDEITDTDVLELIRKGEENIILRYIFQKMPEIVSNFTFSEFKEYLEYMHGVLGMDIGTVEVSCVVASETLTKSEKIRLLFSTVFMERCNTEEVTKLLKNLIHGLNDDDIDVKNRDDFVEWVSNLLLKSNPTESDQTK